MLLSAVVRGAGAGESEEAVFFAGPLSFKDATCSFLPSADCWCDIDAPPSRGRLPSPCVDEVSSGLLGLLGVKPVPAVVGLIRLVSDWLAEAGQP